MSERSYGSLTLPSKGLLYEGKLPGGVIEFYDWGTDIEELFAGSSASTNALIDAVIKRTMKTQDIKPEELLSGDKLFIFFMCRSKAYGAEYGFPYRCSNCGFQSRGSIRIPDDLEVIELDDDAEEPFEVELPISGDTLGFRLMRGKDEIEIEKYVTRIFKKSNPIGDPGYKYRWAKHIVTINGQEVENVMKAQEYVSKMTARDSQAFRKKIDETEPKFNFEIDVTCKKCGNEDSMILPLGREFLDPMN